MNFYQNIFCSPALKAMTLIALSCGVSAHSFANSPRVDARTTWWDATPWFSAKKPKDFTLTLLHMNDHHSHLAADDFDFDVSNLALTATTESGDPIQEVKINYGGFPLLVELFQQEEKRLKRDRENYLKLHSGDAITGTLYYTLFEGKADADMMNQICFDAFALGNHEFDDGDAGLANFLTDLNSGKCKTPVLAANVIPGPDSPLKEGFIQPFAIEYFGKEKVGLIGIDIAQKTKVSSNPDEGTEFLDELETAQFYIDLLRNEYNIDKIVLMTHFQYENDIALANALNGVDVIVGGDSHSLLGGESFEVLGFNTVGEYPTVTTDAEGKNVCIVQAWEYAHLLGKLKVKFDEEGDVKSCTGTPLMPIERGEFTYEYSDSEDRKLEGLDIRAVSRAFRPFKELKLVKPDTKTARLLAGFDEQVVVLQQTIIGSVSEDLCLERFPGQGRSALCDVSETLANGSDISNIVAKAFLTVTPTADIAIQNAGGVRVDVPAGDYTIADAFTLLPFSNTLVTLEMTGQQIKDVLEEALGNALDNGGSTGSYPYASGLRYNVDASAPAGNRISNLQINPRIMGNWETITLGATYTVVTNDFIAAGRDGYTTFGEVFSAGDFVDTFTEYAQGFIDYVELLTDRGESLSKLPPEEYSTQQYIGRDGCNHTTSVCTGF